MTEYPIDKKLVIAVASSALFELGEADRIYREKGETAYRQYQRKNETEILEKGVAFPFISRLLNINKIYKKNEIKPIEVILLSKNDPDTGLRVTHSIEYYKLDITRNAFLNGGDPYKYIPAFNVSLFLSADAKDVKTAILNGYPAGRVIKKPLNYDSDDNDELRIAFDIDGVIADDQSEKVYEKKGLDGFKKNEERKKEQPLDPGPLSNLFKKLSDIQKYELNLKDNDPKYKRLLKIAIVTARNSHAATKRVVTTLREVGIIVDEAFFLGGIDKSKVLKIFKPHIFFDDQISNLQAVNIPSVHIPFGIKNKTEKEKNIKIKKK